MNDNPEYWQEKYLTTDTPWDIGGVSPPLKRFIDGLEDTGIRILIPGAGRAYEAAYLHEKGFNQVYVCDWAPQAFGQLAQTAPDFPKSHMLVADFFTLDLKVDLILEQTFFCAIHPGLREQYVKKAYELLTDDGWITGLLFDCTFEKDGPPYGGDKQEYATLFSNLFSLTMLETSLDSIRPRAGRELFFRFQKQSQAPTIYIESK